MHITFSPILQSWRPQGNSVSHKMKNGVAFLAIAILLGCTLYYIYRHFWEQRSIKPLLPAQQPKLSPQVFQKIVPPKEEKKSVTDASPKSAEPAPLCHLLKRKKPLPQLHKKNLPKLHRRSKKKAVPKSLLCQKRESRLRSDRSKKRRKKNSRP